MNNKNKPPKKTLPDYAINRAFTLIVVSFFLMFINDGIYPILLLWGYYFLVTVPEALENQGNDFDFEKWIDGYNERNKK